MDEELIARLATLSDDQVVKAVLNAAARKKLADDDFAYIDSKGGRHLPIHDEAHVKAALARFNQTHFESAAKRKSAAARIRAAAKKFGIAVSEDDDVAKAERAETGAAGLFVKIEKADSLNGIIYGRVNQANLIDHQQEFIRPDELRKACWGFMRYLQSGAGESPVNDTHCFGDIPGAVVECWTEPNGDWMIGFQPDDIEIAKAAARGDYVGWSMEGTGNRVEVSV